MIIFVDHSARKHPIKNVGGLCKVGAAHWYCSQLGRMGMFVFMPLFLAYLSDANLQEQHFRY